jgi:hypothetical protein
MCRIKTNEDNCYPETSLKVQYGKEDGDAVPKEGLPRLFCNSGF